MPVQGGELEPLVAYRELECNEPVDWSSRGQVLHQGWAYGDYAFFVVADADGSDVSLLGGSETEWWWQLAWIARGTKILFKRHRLGTPPRVCKMTAAGTDIACFRATIGVRELELAPFRRRFAHNLVTEKKSSVFIRRVRDGGLFRRFRLMYF